MNTIKRLTTTLLATLLLGGGVFAKNRPNVILILTDDQGYGDIKAHGHPFIQTPNMDKLHAEAVRFTNFHVAPMCTPTRGQLMTGVDAMKNGATHVAAGRSMFRREIPTLANYFGDAGYKTILSGKWHLGDSYPHRPQDRGFQEVLANRAWGISSLASNWANSPLNDTEPSDEYHDPVLEHNGVDIPLRGYVTDVLFDHAMESMRLAKTEDTPFFLYLTPPTPHVPNISPDDKLPYYQKLDPYEGKTVHADYYGMIENIDDNLGRLEAFLTEEGLRKNTILIYLSDNGTQSRLAQALYNAGMRGKKTELLDGGHRVPGFFRHPASEIEHGRDVGELTQVQDICPTLLELCEIQPANLYPQNGDSIVPLLKGEPWSRKDRILFGQYTTNCDLWNKAVAMQDSWRLLDGELYNIKTDPHQDQNLADEYPERAKQMDAAYRAWHKDAFALWSKTRYIDLGHPEALSTILYSSDWQGDFCDNPGGLTKATSKGVWHVNVVQSGKYKVELSRWPFEADKKLTEGASSDPTKTKGARPIAQASLQIENNKLSLETNPKDTKVSFEVTLNEGKRSLATMFYDADGAELCGALYVRVSKR